MKDVNHLLAFCTKERMQGLAKASSLSKLPVFVCSMPRSGTTLIDQIINAHPNAHGARAISDIDLIRYGLPDVAAERARYPDVLPSLSSDDLDQLAVPHLQRLASMGPDLKAVVNKNLENYKIIPLIHALFPGGSMIHAVRNGLDCSMSVYMTAFNIQLQSYTCRLEDIGFVYRQHERIMAHWERVMDAPILTMRYEEMVDDPETKTRELIDFCGLPWDDACLRFHEKKRSVMTPSYHQVAQPIYKTSVGRFEKYGSMIDGLRRELEAPI
jgi:hypothetical protein